MSAVFTQKPKAGTQSKSTPGTTIETALDRARVLLHPLNLHWAGVVLFALVNLYFLVQIGLLWRSSSNHNADAISQQRIALRAAEIAAEPLRGLDAKLARSTDEADQFSHQRLPGTDSEIAAELGLLTKKQAVRLTRAQYVHTPVMTGSAGALTEVRIDATLTGDYRPLVQFINSVERNKMFFIINSQTLNGQQTGTVNLRVRMTTYERGVAGNAPSVIATSSTGGAR
jgi:hypothetical protein